MQTTYKRTEGETLIPLDCWADFVKEFRKLNKRAAKLGSDPITYTIVHDRVGATRSHYFKTEDGEYSKDVKVEARVIILTGPAPKVEGWQFIARVEYLVDGSTLFHTVPGHDIKIDERFRSLGRGVCEHCNKARIRNDTFIVCEAATGKQTQVGRQCLADFTGINTPGKMAAAVSLWTVFHNLRGCEERMWSTAFEDTIDVERALVLTSAYISTLGWNPKSSGVGTPTSSHVARHFVLGVGESSDERALRIQHNALAQEQAHVQRAAEVLAWLQGELANKARSDYELNLVTLATRDVAQRKHLGIICSAVASYQRAMNKQVEYAQRKDEQKVLNATSTHVGAVGERLRNVKGKIEFVLGLEANEWGPRTLVKLRDEAGNLYVWFASGDRDFTTGASVTFTGTVKKHDDYQGTKQTTLSRVII